MIALAIAVSFLGALAFAAFALWLLYGKHLLADLKSAEARLAALVAAGLAESKAEAESVRSDMNQLAAAMNLTRAGTSFTGRGPATVSAAGVLR